MLRKDIFGKLYRYSKIISQIPEHKLEIVQSDMTEKLRDLDLIHKRIADIENEPNNSAITSYLNFVTHKTKFYQMVNKLTEPKLPEDIDKFTEEMPSDLTLLELGENIASSILSIEAIEALKNKTKAEPTYVKEIEEGKYHMVNGKLVKGEGVVRDKALYSNWNASNVDPDDLNKHKELLDRQYFSGPFWEGKEKPVSIEKQVPYVDFDEYRTWQEKPAPGQPIINEEELGVQEFEEIKN